MKVVNFTPYCQCKKLITCGKLCREIIGKLWCEISKYIKFAGNALFQQAVRDNVFVFLIEALVQCAKNIACSFFIAIAEGTAGWYFFQVQVVELAIAQFKPGLNCTQVGAPGKNVIQHGGKVVFETELPGKLVGLVGFAGRLYQRSVYQRKYLRKYRLSDIICNFIVRHFL
ncbi:MAG: hypothetical protein QM629_09360 [Parafilimonas sp.]